MGWQEAGIAWSSRARDWAYFMEPLFLPLYEQLLQPLTWVLGQTCSTSGVERVSVSIATRAAAPTSLESMQQLGC